MRAKTRPAFYHAVLGALRERHNGGAGSGNLRCTARADQDDQVEIEVDGI